ncbi:MAG: Arc family DNA-binding protein [Verrucomicrobiae bacterium]|nr:Arc family DNA-binding protein [Verrucomicrobiae bacterium]MCP5520057.1 Arc family DNA-binding protein [Verrucomicrobiales bacterium]
MAGRKAFLMRIDPDLWREIEAWAQQDLRSVNGQIEFLLRQAVNRRRREERADTVTAPDQGPGEPRP